MTTPAGVYPFATQGGDSIPLDIIKPSGLLKKTSLASGSSSFVIPAGYSVGIFYCTEDAVVSFGADNTTLVEGTVSDETLFLPADAFVTSAFDAGTAYVRSISVNGILYLQLIEKWAGLGYNNQFTRA